MAEFGGTSKRKREDGRVESGEESTESRGKTRRNDCRRGTLKPGGTAGGRNEKIGENGGSAVGGKRRVGVVATGLNRLAGEKRGSPV